VETLNLSLAEDVAAAPQKPAASEPARPKPVPDRRQAALLPAGVGRPQE